MTDKEIDTSIDGLLAVLIVCDFLHRMTLPREVSRLMTEATEYADEMMTQELFFGS